MAIWFESGPEDDVVISSRIRLARNYQDIPFPPMMSKDQAKIVIDRTKSILAEERLRCVTLSDLHDIERRVLVERHLISPNLLQRAAVSAALINERETVSIMLNEEDHLRIQCLLPGLQLAKAVEQAYHIDLKLEEKATFSFHEKLGYLTACPTNVGTGMRASVMLHLPALNLGGNLQSVIQVLSKIGLTIRGIYGEGTEASANLFQISNQASLGLTEEEIIKNLQETCKQIVKRERAAREVLKQEYSVDLQDKLWRAYGILQTARQMNLKEFMRLFSHVKLGMALGEIEIKNPSAFNALMVTAQPAGLQKQAGQELSEKEMDIMRADIIRKALH